MKTNVMSHWNPRAQIHASAKKNICGRKRKRKKKGGVSECQVQVHTNTKTKHTQRINIVMKTKEVDEVEKGGG
jgi:hypothetical protein